jgi:hypothetical protein
MKKEILWRIAQNSVNIHKEFMVLFVLSCRVFLGILHVESKYKLIKLFFASSYAAKHIESLKKNNVL